MIYASLNAKKGNYQYPAAIATALEFLAKPETAELPVGRYELDGDNIFVLIQDQTTDWLSKFGGSAWAPFWGYGEIL